MGKKPKRKTKGPPVYDLPYHVDEARSLAQLHGWKAGQTGTGLIDRYNTAITKPIRDLGLRELELLLSQRTDAHFFFRVALRTLERDIGATYGSGLLYCALTIPSEFWQTHPHHAGQLAALIEANEARVPENVKSMADDFVARRGREGGP